MLISFKGKGCENCPFYAVDFCGLDEATVLDEDPVEINDGKGLLKEPAKDWPKGCPFGDHVGTLQITAVDGTC